MPEINSVIGLSWEPKLPLLTSESTSTTGSTKNGSSFSSNNVETSALYKHSSELIDGLFVTPNDPRKLNKLLKKQIKDTAGKNWFDMPAPVISPELKKDLQLLKLRSAIDPTRHYKKGNSKSKTLPKYLQVGTVIESAEEFYTGRLTKKERKATLADELLSDRNLGAYRKRKVREIEEVNRPGGVAKWKRSGKRRKIAMVGKGKRNR
ncbi:Fcf2 pre-rRNA proCES [Forsythia ovata]|uniref:Fcf2 pre-rRNA proCES n=1 Tax=Forsythia ovata TaxID=205694 RepID=A0ABD1V114_9LAMI